MYLELATRAIYIRLSLDLVWKLVSGRPKYLKMVPMATQSSQPLVQSTCARPNMATPCLYRSVHPRLTRLVTQFRRRRCPRPSLGRAVVGHRDGEWAWDGFCGQRNQLNGTKKHVPGFTLVPIRRRTNLEKTVGKENK